MPAFMLCARWKSEVSSSACGPPRRTLSKGSEATEVTTPEWIKEVRRSADTQNVSHQRVLPESACARGDCSAPPFPLCFPHLSPCVSPLKRMYVNRLAANASIYALREMEVRGLIKRLRAAPPHPIEGKRSHGGNHSRVE